MCERDLTRADLRTLNTRIAEFAMMIVVIFSCLCDVNVCISSSFRF